MVVEKLGEPEPRKGDDEEEEMKAVPGPRQESHVDRPTPNVPPRGNSPLTSHLRFSSSSISLLADPTAPSTTRNTGGSTQHAAKASTTSSVATTGIMDAGSTPSTSGSRRTTSGTTRMSVACVDTPSSVRRMRARWSRAAAAEGGGARVGCKLRATAVGCWFLPCGVDYAWVVWCQWGRVYSQMRARIPSA